jgi:hypothetical protein
MGGTRKWTLILLMLAGVVIGGFIGEYLGTLTYFSWLSYGSDFGLKSPVVLDLGVLTLQFGFTVRFTICGIIGMLLALLAFKYWA